MHNFEPSFLAKKLLEYAPLGLEEVTGVRSRQVGGKEEEVKWIVPPFHFVWESACLTSVAIKFLNSHEAQVLWAKACKKEHLVSRIVWRGKLPFPQWPRF